MYTPQDSIPEPLTYNGWGCGTSPNRIVAPIGKPNQRLCRLLTDVPYADECINAALLWSDLEQQLRRANCCRSPQQRQLLEVADQKIKLPARSSYSTNWAKQAAWNKYDALASIVTCADYSRAEDLIHCDYASFKCHDRLLCPLCCHNYLARPVLEEFGDKLGADTEVFYIVLSLSSNPDETQRLKFKDIGMDEFQNLTSRGASETCVDQEYGIEFQTGDDQRDCRILWNFFNEAICEFTGSKRGSMFSGSVGGPELAVRFQPLRVLPHANYICWSSGFSVDGARRLRKFIRKKMRDCRCLNTKLFPAVACYRLAAKDDLRKVINYIFKRIDLATAYINAAERSDHMPAAMDSLNHETRQFLNNSLSIFWRLRRLSRYGRCCANHREYFGHVSDYRLAQRERNSERRMLRGSRDPGMKSKGGDVDRWERRYLEQLDHPPRPQHSRFSYWKQRHERPPIPPNRAKPRR